MMQGRLAALSSKYDIYLVSNFTNIHYVSLNSHRKMLYLHVRRKEHLLLQMFVSKDNVEYIDAYRLDMLLRNHNGTKFKIKTARNHRVHKNPYYRGVYGKDFKCYTFFIIKSKLNRKSKKRDIVPSK